MPTPQQPFEAKPAASVQPRKDGPTGSRAPIDFSKPVSKPKPGQKDPGGARMIAHLMDDVVRIPGTKITFGLDSVLSLIPGLGSSAGTVISSAILIQAVRQRVPLVVLGRMVLTLIFDWLLGLLPGIGPVADAFFRSNRRNLRLLEREALNSDHEKKVSGWYLIAALVMVVGIIVLLGITAVLALYAIYTMATGQ